MGFPDHLLIVSVDIINDYYKLNLNFSDKKCKTIAPAANAFLVHSQTFSQLANFIYRYMFVQTTFMHTCLFFTQSNLPHTANSITNNTPKTKNE